MQRHTRRWSTDPLLWVKYRGTQSIFKGTSINLLLDYIFLYTQFFVKFKVKLSAFLFD